MKFILTALLPIFALPAFSQDWKNDTCTLRGSVKSVEHTVVQYFDDGEIVSKDERNSTFNPQGFLVEQTRLLTSNGDVYPANKIYRKFDASGKRCLADYQTYDNEDTSRREEFHYDQTGRITESVYIVDNKRWNTEKYDYQNQLLAKKTCRTVNDWTSTESFIYDELGHLIYRDDLSSTSKQYWLSSYNTNGQLATEKYLDSNFAPRTTVYVGQLNTIDSTTTLDQSKNPNTENSYIHSYRYDQNGKLAEKTETTLDGKLIKSFTYNEKGDPITQSWQNPNLDTPSTATIKYKYDKRGNWTEKTMTAYGVLISKETQKITYY